MFSFTVARVLTSFIVLGLAFVHHAHAHYFWYDDNEGFGANPPETDPFLPVTDEHHAAWNRVIQHCLPLNTQESLSEPCMTSLREYFDNEPVWSYSEMFVYMPQGWRPFVRNRLSLRRNHSPADFLNPNVPFWRHIFDDQIERRQELFLRVVNDSKCQELANPQKDGMHDNLAEHCTAREMYQYAAYLSACFDAKHRISWLQSVIPEDDLEYGGLTTFEYSFQLLDERVSDEALKSAAKRSMEKSYLHASWVETQCSQHGFVLRPGRTGGSYTTSDEKLNWGADYEKLYLFLNHTVDFIMKIAIKSGDDWAIRSGRLSRYVIAEFGDDMMARYPLLMHRVIGYGHGYGYGIEFTSEELLRHRAKAYLLLVEDAGEEFAQQEYDPADLTEEIHYVENGGRLRSPFSRAQVEETPRELHRQVLEKEVLQEVQGELSK